jgi:SAM-dependent methyltransferase
VEISCRSCATGALRIFHEVEGVPVYCSRFLSSRKEALEVPRGDLRLGFCPACGLVQNLAFDPGAVDSTASYEDSQAFSPRFRSFAESLVRDLVERHALQGKRVFEIGCGKGDFLALLCELGEMRGVGMDPAWQPGRLEGPALDRVEFVQAFFDPMHGLIDADLVCCRHTLEHVSDPMQFVHLVRERLDPERQPVVFFEVPDVARVLEEGAFWDLYYEHCSYFSLGSLARLFRAAGFEILRLARGFADQYLLIEARLGEQGGLDACEADLPALAAGVARFAKQVPESLRDWRQRLAFLGREGPLALWGASSKAVGFLATLGLSDEVEVAVDINPHKQGLYLAGTGQRIVAPGFLRELRPAHVLVMNPVYLGEIQAELERMGVAAGVSAV